LAGNIKTIGPDVNSQDLNDNFSDYLAHLAETAQTDDVHGLKTLFQNQQFTNLLKGGGFASWSQGDSAPPDGWKLPGGSVSKQTGAEIGYIVRLENTVDNDAQLDQRLSQLSPFLAGKTVTAVARVKASVANRFGIRIQDYNGSGWEATSSYHSGSGDFEILSVTRTIRADATDVWFVCKTESGTATSVDIDWAMLVIGELPVAFANNPLDKALKAVDYQDSAGTNYIYGMLRIQVGIVQITGDGASQYLDKTVTYPSAFSKTLVNSITTAGFGPIVTWSIGSGTPTTTGFTARVATHDGSNLVNGTVYTAYWLSIGVN